MCLATPDCGILFFCFVFLLPPAVKNVWLPVTSIVDRYLMNRHAERIDWAPQRALSHLNFKSTKPIHHLLKKYLRFAFSYKKTAKVECFYYCNYFLILLTYPCLFMYIQYTYCISVLQILIICTLVKVNWNTSLRE